MTKGVIHIPKSDSGRIGCGAADGSGFKVLHKQVGYQWANWGTDGNTMYLSIIHTLKLKEGAFEGEL